MSCQDSVMQEWMEAQRDTYLRVFLWHEGRGEEESIACPRCEDRTRARLRCRDCVGGVVMCSTCCVELHRRNPLHVVEQWTGVYFQKTSLKAHGLRVQLGHAFGITCTRRFPAHEEFVVLHVNGVHNVAVDFCGCKQRHVAWNIQLLRTGWYPATMERPQTCATFACLDQYQALSLRAKISAYDYYSLLEYLTDGTSRKLPSRYQVFLRMSRQYRHLQLLKRAGRGHDEGGVRATAPGELALRCPACPRPGINLPSDWESATPEDRCVYVLTLALDACFRLKRRAVSNDVRDPGLGTGWAYMVEWMPYRQYLVSVSDQVEMSTCTGLAALDYANTKFSRGYATTGVGMGICARHEFVQPNGVGDLQKGERYANMDYIAGSMLRHLDPRLRKIFSYDIACQWWKHLKERLALLPPLVRFNLVLSLCRFVIPKMHIKGHATSCQAEFSLNLVPGSGQTDGEGIERSWAAIGGAAASTRASGPGSRADQLDDHWQFWNWSKTVGLVALLRRRLDGARVELQRQEDAFDEFSLQQANQVAAWKEMIDAYERDGSAKNPYSLEIKGLTEMQMRARFEEEEAKEAAAGRPRIHEVSSSGFITAALDLEDQQRRIRAQAELKRAQSTALKINLRSMRQKLNREIRKFRVLQATYLPAALVHLIALKVPSNTLAEDVPLILPSDLTEEQRAGGCVDGLFDMEREMRDAQCRTALVSLRLQLSVKARFLIYKKNHSRAQGMNTRSRTLIARNESKIRLHSEKYQRAHAALSAIIPGGAAAVGWRVLRKDDIRCMEDAVQLSLRQEKERRARVREAKTRAELQAAGLPPLVNSRTDVLDTVTRGHGGGGADDDDDLVTVGESHREVSWIWTLAGTAGSDESELAEALRIEWSKAYARVRRWREEVKILEAEWQRLPLSFAHEVSKWDCRVVAVPVGAVEVPAPEAEGLLAYAMKQADVYRQLAIRAESARIEPKLGRGYRRPREAVRVVTHAMEGDGLLGDEDVGEDDEDEQDGFLDSDDEAIMDGDALD
ncbi:hypothetical protein GGX14DRAFT_359106 [Mycena pura]|uniref:CxC2-like cysteine cluster KDZ transposase-associated domain-containing protein n=1 Tax=Mycena pura TaxID=153505 RepID=A0AAD6YH30_9AGAR|nr:hypothetical protein GGX14DRAFT_359106 [Mycena pura]